MPIQLIALDSPLSTDAPRARRSRSDGIPATLTIEVLSRRDRVAREQHAECSIRIRKPDGHTVRMASGVDAPALTFTA